MEGLGERGFCCPSCDRPGAWDPEGGRHVSRVMSQPGMAQPGQNPWPPGLLSAAGWQGWALLWRKVICPVVHSTEQQTQSSRAGTQTFPQRSASQPWPLGCTQSRFLGTDKLTTAVRLVYLCNYPIGQGRPACFTDGALGPSLEPGWALS